MAIVSEEWARNTGKEIAEIALDECEYRGKTIREWIEVLKATKPVKPYYIKGYQPYYRGKCNAPLVDMEFCFCPYCGAEFDWDAPREVRENNGQQREN